MGLRPFPLRWLGLVLLLVVIVALAQLLVDGPPVDDAGVAVFCGGGCVEIHVCVYVFFVYIIYIYIHM